MAENQEDFLDADSAFEMAIEKLKGNSIKRDKVYVWRQRWKEGKLSHKKFCDILEKAGFKLAVEEKWIFTTAQGEGPPKAPTEQEAPATSEPTL